MFTWQHDLPLTIDGLCLVTVGLGWWPYRLLATFDRYSASIGLRSCTSQHVTGSVSYSLEIDPLELLRHNPLSWVSFVPMRSITVHPAMNMDGAAVRVTAVCRAVVQNLSALGRICS